MWPPNPFIQFTEAVLRELLLNQKNDQNHTDKYQLQGPLGIELVI